MGGSSGSNGEPKRGKKRPPSSSQAPPEPFADPSSISPAYAPDASTLPHGKSFSRGPLPPPGAVARYREVVAPHVESFDYFLDEGLREAVACLTPAEARLSADGETGPLLRLSVEECEVRGVATTRHTQGWPGVHDKDQPNRLNRIESNES